MAVSKADRSREPFLSFLVRVLIFLLREPSNETSVRPTTNLCYGGPIRVEISVYQSVLKVTRWAFSRILSTLRLPFRISKNAVGRNRTETPRQTPRSREQKRPSRARPVQGIYDTSIAIECQERLQGYPS